MRMFIILVQEDGHQFSVYSVMNPSTRLHVMSFWNCFLQLLLMISVPKMEMGGPLCIEQLLMETVIRSNHCLQGKYHSAFEQRSRAGPLSFVPLSSIICPLLRNLSSTNQAARRPQMRDNGLFCTPQSMQKA